MEAISLFNTNNISSMNNPLVNFKNKSLGQNSLSEKNINNTQNLFLKMMNMILGGDAIKQEVEPNQLISEEEIENLISICNQDEKTDNQTQKDYSNIMSMVFGLVENPGYIDFQNTNIIDGGLDYKMLQSNTMINEIVNGNNQNCGFNFQGLAKEPTINNYNNKNEELINKINLIDNNLKNKENNIKNNLSFGNNVDKSFNNVQNKTSSLQSSTNALNEIKPDLVLSSKNSSENVLANLKGKTSDSDDNKNIDLRGNVIENEASIFTKNNNLNKTNEIIEVSDESSEIKKSVFSQIEDKITFMASGKKGMQEVMMELNPKSLGKVNVKMFIENGKIAVEIMALDMKTNNILLSNVNELTKSLQYNNSNTTVSITVTNNELSQYNQSNLNYGQNHRQREQNQTTQNLYNNKENSDESNIISEIINLRNIKLNKVV